MQILLVEDDLPLAAALRDALTHAGFRSVWVRRLAEARAIAFAPNDEPTAIILDISLPDGEGFTLLTEVRRSQNLICNRRRRRATPAPALSDFKG